MESRVIESARQTLKDGRFRSLEADLFGEPYDLRDGVCGGRMTVWLVRLAGAESLRVVEQAGRLLVSGKRVKLSTCAGGDPGLTLVGHSEATGLHDAQFVETLEPPPRLLIVGAGHVGRALAKQMIPLGFVATVQDDRREMLSAADLPPTYETLRICIAVRVPSFFAPTLIVTFIGCRETLPMNSSVRVHSHFTGRPVRNVASTQSSSLSISCLAPKPPPTRSE